MAGEATVPDDEALARRAQAGDETAFEELVLRYERSVFAFLRGRLGNVQDAEDVAQTVFVKVYRGLDRLDASRPFAPWLFAIARREAASRYRSRSSESRWAPETGGIDAQTPAAALEEREAGENLWDWVRETLGADAFTALWFQVERGAALKDIAVMMERTESSVKVLLHRARRKLADRWAGASKRQPERG